MRFLIPLSVLFTAACQIPGDLKVLGDADEVDTDTTNNPNTENTDEQSEDTDDTDTGVVPYECAEWSSEWTFDGKTVSTVNDRIDQVVESDGTVFASDHGLWYEDDCFGIPADSDIALCVRGSGAQPEDVDGAGQTVYAGGTLVLTLAEGREASWMTFKGCDWSDNNLVIQAWDVNDNELHTEWIPALGEDVCSTDLQIGWHSFTQKAVKFVLSVTTSGTSDAWALNQLAIGNLCEEEETEGL